MRDLDRYEADYIATYGFERHMVRYRRRQIRECLAWYPHRNILEVGCGLEPLFLHLDEWASYTVVEPGRQFAERARQLAPLERNVDVHCVRIEDAAAALDGKTFDFIILSSLLHEVADPTGLLAAVRNLCTGGTLVHINVPNARSLHNRIAVKMGLIPDVFAQSLLAERMQRRSTYDLVTLEELTTRSGFHTQSFGSYFLKPFTSQQLQSMLDQGIITEQVLDALFDVNSDFDGLGSEIYLNVTMR